MYLLLSSPTSSVLTSPAGPSPSSVSPSVILSLLISLPRLSPSIVLSLLPVCPLLSSWLSFPSVPFCHPISPPYLSSSGIPSLLSDYHTVSLPRLSPSLVLSILPVCPRLLYCLDLLSVPVYHDVFPPYLSPSIVLSLLPVYGTVLLPVSQCFQILQVVQSQWV